MGYPKQQPPLAKLHCCWMTCASAATLARHRTAAGGLADICVCGGMVGMWGWETKGGGARRLLHSHLFHPIQLMAEFGLIGDH